jgi:hypothetical protein
MSEPVEEKVPIEVACPCCGAQLLVDPVGRVVIEARDPAGAERKAAELKDARRVLAEESQRIDEKYRQIVEAEKGRGAAMDKLFRNFMEKAKDEPVEKPVRDIDLD